MNTKGSPLVPCDSQWNHANSQGENGNNSAISWPILNLFGTNGQGMIYFVPCCSQWNHKTSQGENAITQLFLDPFWIFLVQINTQSIKQDALIQLSNSQFKICSSVQHFALVFQTPILKSCQSIGKHWWHVSPLVTIGDISVHWLTLVILVASCFIVPMNTIANRQL